MLKIDKSGTGLSEQLYKEYVEKALKAFDTLEAGNGAGNDFLGWNNLPSTTPMSLLDDCNAILDKWLSMNIDLVVVIGIGGSYLGARATIEALKHSFALNMGEAFGPQVVFAGNNLSEDYIAELFDLMEMRNCAAVVISKSGTTTEPAIAFRLVKKYIEDKYGKEEAADRIVAITDKARGALKTLADAEGYPEFVIEDNIGGRFSVLTPVGLLPIALAGYNICDLISGAQDMEKICAER
ncbi:MAG: glucose-6-phosphate isomerase, partial [Bacteroidales bacterium]|nr:glucose-6-phosphate isomerase [Bacteroidales bacterium]